MTAAYSAIITTTNAFATARIPVTGYLCPRRSGFFRRVHSNAVLTVKTDIDLNELSHLQTIVTSTESGSYVLHLRSLRYCRLSRPRTNTELLF